ncbi:HxlR family transcriptional regulator [Streptomyces sulfonofaciens]|uniref:HxlR family transcriptional regulator n=1 Tax=Streptomyces sulfonofaciens TaxID=68272 RepID=A0A919GJC6_9ACTN|nr:HxlR family transcriptional regulator [Streptomyces sulfonofaciens]
MILRELFAGNARFEGLRTELGASDNVLATRLARMTEAGLAERIPYGGTVRPRVEYRLTDAGHDALPVLHALAHWGAKHTAAPERARPMAITCTGCGRPTRSADWCTTCDRPLTTERTAWTRPGTGGPPIRLASVVRPASPGTHVQPKETNP